LRKLPRRPEVEALERAASGDIFHFTRGDRKRDTDPLGFEQRTPGYTLVNLNAGYEWRYLRLEAGATNLLNRWYYLPLGGANFDDFQAGGWMGKILPLTGPGRSFYGGMSVPF
jgi:iron complex outermembrane receptor protein